MSMRIRPLVLATALSVAAGVGSLASTAAAEPDPPAPTADTKVDEARTRFARGVDLYRDGDFRAAVIEFQRAYDLAPNYRVLFNIGQANQELQNYAAALDAYERYLKDGGDEIDADRRKLVQGEVEKLAGRVAQVSVTANVDGATVTIDDVTVGTTPVADPIRVSAGRRKITVSKPGFLPMTRDVDLAGRDKKDLDFKLTALTAGRSDKASPAPVVPRRESKGMSTGFWIGMGATAALAVTAGVVGYAAIQAKSDHDDMLDKLGTTQGQIDDSRKKVKNLSLAADILGGAALITGTLTLVLTTGSSGEQTGMTVGPRGGSLWGTF